MEDVLLVCKTMDEKDLSNAFLPEGHDELSEDDLYQAIKERVSVLLEQNPEILMSYLYRLDVLEVKIKAILSPESLVAPVEGLSRLILERQKERIATKKKYKSPPPEKGWEW